MSGRRSEIRYRLSVPHDGELVITRDAAVESTTDTQICVLSDVPEARGQELTLELAAGAASTGFHVRVAECSAIVVAGSVRYRLRFAVNGRHGHSWPSVPRRLSSEELLGVMVVTVPSRLVDVSRTGCLLETERHIVTGTIGEIRIAVPGQVLSEELRVTWGNRVEGAGALCRVGTEFLRTRRLDGSCLRRAFHSVLDGHTQQRTVSTGRFGS